MLSAEEKLELCQISLTGLRALILCGLLIDAPRSIEEIKNKFVEFKLMAPDSPNDIIRIDLNTLRVMGFEITRATKKTGNKYILKDYPFALKIDEKEVSLLKNAYNQIKNDIKLSTLLEYHQLIKKIARYVTNDEIKEILYGISVLKSVDIDNLEELIKDCKYKRILKIEYQPPYSKNPEEKEISTKDVVIQNDKIYLYGFDINLKEAVTLNFNRIKKIISKKDSNEEFEIKPLVIKFLIKEFGVAGLTENEKIVEKRDEGFIIEGQYHNEFVARQRILSFGSTCTVLEPEDFKQHIIDLLQKMRAIYNE